MYFETQTFSMPKLGNHDIECEDAYAISEVRYHANKITGTHQRQHARYAVTDGATMTSFSREWAQQVANYFIEAPSPPFPALRNRLTLVQEQWKKQYITSGLPWYALQKAQKGAFTTLLGLCLHRGKPGKNFSWGYWTATAIGDTCLFQIRDKECICTFPLENPEQFGNSPMLISSMASFGTVSSYERTTHKGWRLGDIFYIATDALAEWMVRDKDSKPWQQIDRYLLDIEPSQGREWMGAMIYDKKVRNDDITVVRIHVIEE